MMAILAGCGGSNGNVQNPPPPPASKVSIAFQPEPSPSLAVSFSENLTAVVSNDSSNAGVDWTLTCQNPGNCGSLSAPHTASGTATTYTAPSTLSANSLTVEIVALATADQNQNVVAPITVTTFSGSLKGTYVLQAEGVDVNGGPNYQFAGVIVLDGNGGISSGEQTINFLDQKSGALVSKSDSIVAAPNSYFVGSDGRGTLTITTADNDIGYGSANPGVETFTFVLLSSSQALISQMDLTNAAGACIACTGTSATGTMDLQTSTAAPSGGYAFVVSGTDVVKTLPIAFGGVFNVDSPDTISGNGSVTDEILAKKVTATDLGLSGTLTTPDQFGAFTLNLTAPFGVANKPIPLQFTGYIVDTTHIKLIETDNTSGSTTAFGSTAGIAIGQGTATGTFTGNASLSGTYVFGVSGVDLSNSNILPSTLTSAGVFTADGNGNLNNGFTDTFLLFNTDQGTVNNPQNGRPDQRGIRWNVFRRLQRNRSRQLELQQLQSRSQARLSAGVLFLSHRQREPAAGSRGRGSPLSIAGSGNRVPANCASHIQRRLRVKLRPGQFVRRERRHGPDECDAHASVVVWRCRLQSCFQFQHRPTVQRRFL